VGALPEVGPDTSLQDFLDALASDQPTPGGGGAAALAAALGAALVAMTARLTVGRRRYRSVEADMQRVIARADEIRGETLGLVRADAEVYGEVMRAYGLPRETEAEKDARREALARAAEAAGRVPLRVGALSAELIDLAHETVEKGNRNVISDAGSAAALARAAIRISEMNVEANAGLIADPAVQAEFERGLAGMRAARDRADVPVDRVLHGGGS
jgi:formiminotetrahydrofolate cyclodeaminase